MMPLMLSAQNNEVESAKGDSIHKIEVKISAEELAALENSKANLDKRLKVAIKTISDLQMKIQKDSVSIKKSYAQISKLRADSLSTHDALKNIQEQYKYNKQNSRKNCRFNNLSSIKRNDILSKRKKNNS